MILVFKYLLIFSTVLSGFVAIYAYRKRPMLCAVPFSALMFAAAIWALAASQVIEASTFREKLIWTNISYIAIVVIPAAALILSIQFTRRGRRLDSPWYYLLAIEPLLVIGLVWSNETHHLFWRNIELQQGFYFQSLKFENGPGFWVHIIYSHTLGLISASFLARYATRSSLLYRNQAAALLAGAALPWLARLVYILFLVQVPTIDPTPFFFIFTGLVVCWRLFRFRVLGVLPVAYDIIIEGMGDGLIVLDLESRVIETNPSAEKILGFKGIEITGMSVYEAFPDQPDLLENLETPTEIKINVSPGTFPPDRYYMFRNIPLYDGKQRLKGRMILIQDFTDEKKREDSQKRRIAELDALHRALVDITASQDIDSLLEKITIRAADLVQAYGASLYRLVKEQGVIECIVNYRNPIEEKGSVKPLGQDIAGIVAETSEPLVIAGYANRDQSPDLEHIPGSLSAIAVPLRLSEDVPGVLVVVYDKLENKFIEIDLELLSMFANQSVVVIENTRLLQSERRQREQADTLQQISRVINSSLDLDCVLDNILEQLARVIAYDSISIQLIKDDHLEIVGSRGWPDPESVVGLRFSIANDANDNPHARVIKTRQPVIIQDATDCWESFKQPVHSHIRSWLGVPLIVHDRVIGMISVNSKSACAYNDDHARLISAFADQVAIAIENARLYAEAEWRARELSQLYAAAQDLTQSLEPQVILSKLAKHLTVALNATSGYIIDVDLENEKLVVVAEYWSEEAGEKERVSDLHRVYSLSDYTSVTDAYRMREPVSYTPDSPERTQAERSELLAYGVKTALLVPIISRGELIGQVEIWESRYERSFSNAEKLLSMALAQHAAAVLENAHLYTAERMRVAELNALQDTMSDLSSKLELPKLLQAILERSVEMLKGTGGQLGLYDANRGRLEIVASYQMDRDYTGLVMALGEGVMGRVAQSCEPLIVANYQQWEGRSPQYYDSTWATIVAVPLLIGGRLLGVLEVVDADPNRKFSSSEQHLLNLFAQHAAIAVENARLYTEARQAADRRAILHHASQEVVAASLDPEGIYITLHTAASRLMPTEAFAITLLDEKRNMIDAVYIYDHQGRAQPVSFPANRGLSGAVIANGSSLYIRDLLIEGDKVDSIRVGDNEDVRSIIAVPMRLGGKIIGMLSAQSYLPEAYTDDDVALLEMLASYAAIALDNARLFGEVQKLAITDPITGIYNRRQLFELGQREFSRSLRFGRPLAVIFFDIDDFKIVNDTLGHPAGDIVLRELAQIVQDMIRETDILGRYGGEEFVVVLPETTNMAAEWVAERIRKRVSITQFQTNKGETRITVSIGIAEITPDIPDFAALVARADEAMYEAKEAGKNRVAVR